MSYPILPDLTPHRINFETYPCENPKIMLLQGVISYF